MTVRLLLLSAICMVALSVSAGPRAHAEHTKWHQAASTIEADQLKQHVAALADDTFEGREAGTRGGRAAAAYITRRLEATNGTPVGNGESWSQPFGNGYRNILVYFEGVDPTLKDEVILIGAHYDHVGFGRSGNSLGPAGYIHNGADDNASGVATLLEMIDAVEQLPQRPRRSLLFAFWDAEERGLLGAKHWTRQPTIDLKRISYHINLDMVGRMRSNRLMMFGTRTADGARRFVSELNEQLAMNIDFSWELKENSDHWPFLRNNIPVLMPHTDKHGDYHRPSDDTERINSSGMEQVAKLTFAITYQLAMQDQIPKFRPAWRYENEGTRRRSQQRLTDHASRLGVAWEARFDAEGPIVVTRIAPYSAAAKAGLQVGDQIVGVGTQPIQNGASVRAAVLTAPIETELTVLRGEDRTALTLPLMLQGKPIRVGLSWRADSAEADTIFVSRVVAGSPADQAGVRPGDRIYSLNGKRIGPEEGWREALTAAPFPFELVLEYQGRLRTLTLREFDFESVPPIDTSNEQSRRDPATSDVSPTA